MAMLESIRRHSPGARFTVLSLSTDCGDLLRKFGAGDIEIVTTFELESRFPELAACRSDRSELEYYFTCTPFLFLFVLTRLKRMELVTYLDADLWFFSDPEPLFEEIGAASVALIPHRFPPDLAHCEAYGRFNVGWVTIRAAPDGLACLQWWARRCAEWCRDRAEPGRFADQKYLDQVPSLFAGVHIIKHPGANLAPWNVRSHALSGKKGGVRVDGAALLFFHFHGFKFPNSWLTELPFRIYGVSLTPLLRDSIVGPYLKALARWKRRLSHESALPRVGVPEPADAESPMSWRGIAARIKAGDCLVRGSRALIFRFLAR